MRPPPPRLETRDALELNFALYVTGKIIARQGLPDDSHRKAFSSELGRSLLSSLAPVSSPRDVSLRERVQELLETLVAEGYCRSYVLTWGSSPGLPSAPGSAAATASVVEDAEELPLRAAQIRLNAPIDIAGGIALRAEEGGWWPSPVASSLLALWGRAGYADAQCDESFFQDQWVSPPRLADRMLLALGDPLGSVEVPFVPDVLVLDFAW